MYGFNNENLNILKLNKIFSENGKISNDNEIDLKYFLNNAYVSVTRAQKQLFIIDSMVDREESSWDFAFSDPRTQKDVTKIEEAMLSRVSSRDDWKKRW